jgi:hypothetical protein
VGSENGDGTARGGRLERGECEEEEVEAREVLEAGRWRQVCSLMVSWNVSSSSSLSSGSNEAARSNGSFHSSRGSRDENEGGREEMDGVAGWTEGEEGMSSVSCCGFSRSLADTWTPDVSIG